jgi:hypothetical protein
MEDTFGMKRTSLFLRPGAEDGFALRKTYLRPAQRHRASFENGRGKIPGSRADNCREHPEITLADLKAASKDWGFDWRPELITETNRTPKCSG